LETASRPVLNKPFNAQTLNGFVQQLIGVRAIQASGRP